MTRAPVRPGSTRAADPIDTVLRLAVLLSAGLPPAAAWAHLAEDGDELLRACARAAGNGDDVAAVLRAGGVRWHGVADVWAVAVAVGAPLADTLREVGSALREATEISGDVRVALAEPRATARLLAWLPVVGIPLGMLLGFDTARVLTRDPIGIGCLVAGAALVLCARLWSERLVGRARPADRIPGMTAELYAVALSAGASIARARGLVTACVPPGGVAYDDPDDTGVETALDLSVRAGVPAVDLLRGQAWLARHRARTRGREAAARLSTRLLLPLGVCTLPAFLLLAVAPLMLGVLRTGALPP